MFLKYNRSVDKIQNAFYRMQRRESRGNPYLHNHRLINFHRFNGKPFLHPRWKKR